MTTPSVIPLEQIRAAQARIASAVIRMPLVRLNVDTTPADIYLKLENLQPIGSFKLRGASNAMLLASREQLAAGVWTASAGNMAQGVAWQARRMGLPCTIVVPDHAPEAKLQAIRRLGGDIIKVPFAEWFQVLSTRRFAGMDGLFVHPVSDPAVMAGNGTIGLEILEDLPDVDAVLVPFGGGGLSSGIASALRALKPKARIYACEAEPSAALSAALLAGSPKQIDYQASFIDGIGSPSVLADMWPLVSQLLDGSLVQTVDEIAAAIKLLAERNHIIAEGAGAASVAAALAGKVQGKVVCIVSGGNLDAAKLVKILEGQTP
ncbi:MAG TPA: pyridoxal-phosphate dependent enzyme [Ktedonobacterales bacterium]|nr:pyridoxal-phosphate dependent enzyme [Ktedonobacterales bacterium]